MTSQTHVKGGSCRMETSCVLFQPRAEGAGRRLSYRRGDQRQVWPARPRPPQESQAAGPGGGTSERAERAGPGGFQWVTLRSHLLHALNFCFASKTWGRLRTGFFRVLEALKGKHRQRIVLVSGTQLKNSSVRSIWYQLTLQRSLCAEVISNWRDLFVEFTQRAASKELQTWIENPRMMGFCFCF